MKKLLALTAVAATVLAAAAQTTNSGYFLENYTYGYTMNPAMAPDRAFVAVPGLGDLNVAMRGNLHLRNVLYNIDGRTCLFTNPQVSAAEVMPKIKDVSRIGVNVNEQILAVGFRMAGGYSTVSINACADVNARIPKSFFSLAKEGVQNKTYTIDDLSARANGYAQIALNHSRNIAPVPGLRVGASLKFLVGMASLDAQFHQADLTLGQDNWIARTNATLRANIAKFQYDHKTSRDGREYVSGANMDGSGSFGPNGFGMALDLGTTYRWRDFTFSAAVLDLGWLTYSNTLTATTGGLRTVETDAYIFNADSDAPNSFSDEWKHLRDNLETLYQLDDAGNTGSRTVAPAATLNFGVSYTLPAYRRLQFGLLSSTRIEGPYTWTEARLSANINPVRCLSATANYAVGTYGSSFGWLLNVSTKGFNLFLGMDHTLGRLAKQGVPLSSNASVNFGINFPF